MKHIRIFKSFLLCGAALLSFSCAEKFVVGEMNEDSYMKVENPTLCIRNEDGNAVFTTLEIKSDSGVKADFKIVLTKTSGSAVKAEVNLDETLLAAYNDRHGTSYEMYPIDRISISASELNISAGQSSAPFSISLSASKEVDNDVTYAIPVTLETDTGGILPGKEHMILVKDLRGKYFADATKSTGIKTFSCMEVGTANPLFHLAFTLEGKQPENAGKPLFDCVILFSGKIVYDLPTQSLKFDPGVGISAIVSNHEKYIKPLQDMGIKVVVAILGSGSGNPDTGAGVAHLSDAAAKDFAREMADFCEAHKLDGVFLDDEYTYHVQRPCFVTWGTDPAARLCYELKKAMPDKWVITYMYMMMYNFRKQVDGMNPGDFIDYALNDYGGKLGESYYLGMSKSQVGINSTNWSPGYWRNYGDEKSLRAVRDGGYGAYMGYCLDHQTNTWNMQLTQLKNMAKYLYDDELLDSGYRPKPEW